MRSSQDFAFWKVPLSNCRLGYHLQKEFPFGTRRLSSLQKRLCCVLHFSTPARNDSRAMMMMMRGNRVAVVASSGAFSGRTRRRRTKNRGRLDENWNLHRRNASSGGGEPFGRPPRPRRVLAAKKDEDDVKEHVDNAAKVLDSIIKETVEQIFVDEVSEEVFDEVDELSRIESAPSTAFEREKKRRKEMEIEQMRVRVLKSVVKSKFNELDGTFLSVLGAYIKETEMKDDMPLLSLLRAIKEETLQAVTVEMQPEMQVVQLVARLMRGEDRAEVLKIAHKGGGRAKCLKVYGDGEVEDPTEEEKKDEASREDYVPKADIDEVERAAAQLCDEMELREVIPSWDLLYQIILARESARQMSPKSDRLGVYSEIVVSGAFAPSELPKAESALIRKLVRTDDASTRREMLFETMESARIENEKLSEEGRKQHEEGRIKLTKTTRGFTEREEISDEELMLKDLRPGRMIDCLINLRCSLLEDERVKERGEQAVVAERMAVMYFEMCDLVLKNANGGILPTNNTKSNSKNNSTSEGGGGGAGAR